MKRSTCASGSGYVPSCSIGFCVASTRNGSSSVYVVPPIVTCFSCIASSSAACTLAGARLISSARMMLAKIGPFFDRELARRLVVDLRADHVGGQEVGRELDALERRVDGLGERPHGERLGEPRHAFEQHVAAGEQADEQAFDHVVLADDAARDLFGHIVYEA